MTRRCLTPEARARAEEEFKRRNAPDMSPTMTEEEEVLHVEMERNAMIETINELELERDELLARATSPTAADARERARGITDADDVRCNHGPYSGCARVHLTELRERIASAIQSTPTGDARERAEVLVKAYETAKFGGDKIYQRDYLVAQIATALSFTSSPTTAAIEDHEDAERYRALRATSMVEGEFVEFKCVLLMPKWEHGRFHITAIDMAVDTALRQKEPAYNPQQ